MAPRFLMTDPEHFEVSYVINPWMRPDAWRLDPGRNRAASRAAWTSLAEALRGAGAAYVIIAGKPVDYTDDSAAMGVDALAFLHRVREKLS